MNQWNAALEAYDQDLEVIEEVREEYVSYLRSIFERLDSALPTAAGTGWTTSTSGAGPQSTWEALPESGSQVTLYVWAARSYGGLAATLLVGLDLDEGSGFSPDARAMRRKLLVDAAEQNFKGLPGGPPNSASHGDVAATVVRVAPASMKDHPVENVVSIIEAFAPLAAKLNEMLAINQWLAGCLQPMLTSKKLPASIPKQAAWYSDKLCRWRGGHFVQLDQKNPTRCVFVSARPPGELLLGHYYGKIHAGLLKALGASEHPISDNREKVALLLDCAQVDALYRARDIKSVQSKASEALSAYFELADKAS